MELGKEEEELLLFGMRNISEHEKEGEGEHFYASTPFCVLQVSLPSPPFT